MQLTHLSLTNFRNFIRLEADFPAGITLLVGANAQGKTSLLEAIHHLTGAPSVQTTSEHQMINFLAQREQQPFARIAAEVDGRKRTQRIEIRILLEAASPNAPARTHKQVLLNGVKRRWRDLAGAFNAVLFRPQDLLVLEGPPGERRRYLDVALSQADPIYARTLADYAKVLAQRNALLKLLAEKQADSSQLPFWDEQLARCAAGLMRARALALREIEALAAPIHERLTRGKEGLRLQYLPAYDPSLKPADQLGLPLASQLDWVSLSQEQLHEGMLQALQHIRSDEMQRGTTLLGPHRDDFGFLANGVDLRAYGSRGQGRTAMLAAKLAEVEWLRQRIGECPVLLLDEVLAELDAERRDDLLRHVLQVGQVLLTTTELSMFEESFKSRSTLWQVVAGTLHPFEPHPTP